MNDSPNRSAIGDLLEQAPSQLELTDEAHSRAVTTTAEQLLERFPDAGALEHLEEELLADPSCPLLVHVALKVARSKRALRSLTGPGHLSMVFAVYKEHLRILPRSEHPHGEAFLARKVEQLRWLFDDVDGFDWDLTVVDDGCPEGSGRLAEEAIAKLAEPRTRVLYLQDAIARGLPPARGLASPADSRKGGAVQYGMWAASQEPRPGHVIGFTDADLSTHLGQTGLLVAPILGQSFDLAIGSRREPNSVVVKQGTRNVRGKLFIYLWKRLLPQLDHVVDTQCGFKAFRGELVEELVRDTIEKGFAFDIELLLKGELRRANSCTRVPVAWIDSEALSTTTDLQPYLPMLRAVVAFYRRYLPANPESEPFAELIEGLDESAWQRLLDHVPAQIADREPAEFGRYAGVSAAELGRSSGA